MPSFTSSPCRASPMAIGFLLVKARQLWPEAIAVDRYDDVHSTLSPAIGKVADSEIYPSEEDFLRYRDGKGFSTSLGVQVCPDSVTVFGDDAMVAHIAALPVWNSPLRRPTCQTPSAS